MRSSLSVAALLIIAATALGQSFRFSAPDSTYIHSILAASVTKQWSEGKDDTVYFTRNSNGTLEVVSFLGRSYRDRFSSVYDSTGFLIAYFRGSEGDYFKRDPSKRIVQQFWVTHQDTLGPSSTREYDEQGRVVRSFEPQSPNGPNLECRFYYRNAGLLSQHYYISGLQSKFDTVLFDTLGRQVLNYGWEGYYRDNQIGDTSYFRVVSLHLPGIHQRYDTAWLDSPDVAWYTRKPVIIYYDSVARYREARQTPHAKLFEWRQFWDVAGRDGRLEHEDGSSSEWKRFYLPNGLLQREELYSNGLLQHAHVYRYAYRQ